MSSTNKDFFLTANKFERNFSLTFNDLLEDDELVDVQLVADGYLISAHRLILSAISPYFRNMFTQMPVNQQAFVFLKDISKQTVIDLITYIYRGEVNVKQENLDLFMKAAISLNIKGLADGNYSQPLDSHQPDPTPAETFYNGPVHQKRYIDHPFGSSGVQYQAVQRSAQSVLLQQPVNQEKNDFESDEMNEYNYDQNYSDDTSSSNNHSMYDNNEFSFNQWNTDIEVGSNDAKMKSMVKATAPKRKKINNDTSAYNIVADVQDNHNGSGQHLYYGNEKFQKHGKLSANGMQRWQCTKAHSQKCRAAMSTVEVNGVTMMKILANEHSHVK